MNHEEIKARAEEVVKEFGLGNFPVPVVGIATRLGMDVVSDADYQHDKDGHIEIDEHNNATIVVNNEKPPNRKRFTIAHEIAHFIFDKDYLQKHKIIDRDGNASDASYREIEQRANKFASILLMPEEQFIEQWLALRSLEKAANYFRVSQESAKYRAIHLGLIPA